MGRSTIAFVDLVRRVPSERNTSATPPQPGQRGGSAALVPSNIPVAKVAPILDTQALIDKRSLFKAVPFLFPCVAPLDISSVPAKQKGKKQGKGTVNPDDGFASVVRPPSQTLVPEFTNRKDVTSLKTVALSVDTLVSCSHMRLSY